MKTINALLLYCLFVAAPFNLFAADKETAKGGMQNIGVAQFEKLRTNKDSVVLDVRTEKEFAAGHMPGAINIDVNAPDFPEKVKSLDPSKTYLVHCAAGVRSRKAPDRSW